MIANNFSEASGTYRAALIGLGVVLFVHHDPRQRGRAGPSCAGRAPDAEAPDDATDAAVDEPRAGALLSGVRQHAGRRAAATLDRRRSAMVLVVARGAGPAGLHRRLRGQARAPAIIGWDFLTEADPDPSAARSVRGMGPAVVGTLLITLTATVAGDAARGARPPST